MAPEQAVANDVASTHHAAGTAQDRLERTTDYEDETPPDYV